MNEKTFKATLANGEVVTFKAGEFALMPRSLGVNIMKIEECQPYGGWEGSWAGDGSGLDDLADFNAMEGGDM
jgi:hypothetical protein